MIQRISKRFLSLLLVAVMVLALVPAITLPAFAATSGAVTGLSDPTLACALPAQQMMLGVPAARRSSVRLGLRLGQAAAVAVTTVLR